MEQSGLDLDDLRAFLLVAETGSFSRAGHRLDVSKSIVSRRVARLETALSARLLQRTPRGTVLTEAGLIYYEQASVAMTQLECAAEAVNESVTDVSGIIRLTAPMYFGAFYLAPALCEFMSLYPRIDLDVCLSDDKVDLVRDGFDLAVRTGHLPDSSLTVRPLCRSRRILVASADYLRQYPPIRRPEDLSGHRILHYNGLMTHDLWRYHVNGETRLLEITPHLRSNSATMLMNAVAAGHGLTVMPTYITNPATESGKAQEVLTEIDWGYTPINVLTPPGRSTTRRVRMLIDFLVAQFAGRTI